MRFSTLVFGAAFLTITTDIARGPIPPTRILFANSAEDEVVNHRYGPAQRLRPLALIEQKEHTT
jgi:hypothetical protein